jgi:intracellular sulfur oxidation DsrE/DsrF family protein
MAENYNVVLHLNDKAKIPHLERNIANLRKGLGDDVSIQVVINGRAVTSMINGNRLIEETVRNMLNNKASIGICHYAMQNNNVDQNRLVDGRHHFAGRRHRNLGQAAAKGLSLHQTLTRCNIRFFTC